MYQCQNCSATPFFVSMCCNNKICKCLGQHLPVWSQMYKILNSYTVFVFLFHVDGHLVLRDVHAIIFIKASLYSLLVYIVLKYEWEGTIYTSDFVMMKFIFQISILLTSVFHKGLILMVIGHNPACISTLAPCSWVSIWHAVKPYCKVQGQFHWKLQLFH